MRHDSPMTSHTIGGDSDVETKEMVYLTEVHNITILQMIGYGDRTRTQAEVVRLFQEKYPELPPISQGTLRIQKSGRY
ncbi:hypothetical protein NQ318_012056 [Aromia moschata]|uniref:DUF4817 domain-containing protein n=1 Tax=Aromia moschata TaxID=1265417 RepID=A0AAV8XK34_9CUCU|nr:hypothetical protein NQ318_012056 [Aromia moschata]